MVAFGEDPEAHYRRMASIRQPIGIASRGTTGSKLNVAHFPNGGSYPQAMRQRRTQLQVLERSIRGCGTLCDLHPSFLYLLHDWNRTCTEVCSKLTLYLHD